MYRVRETKTPLGYAGQYVSEEFSINSATSRTFSYTAVNTKINPTVSKIEEIARNLDREAAQEVANDNRGSVVEPHNGKFRVVRYLEGAVLQIREDNANGTLVETVTTGKDGKAKITVDLDGNKNYVIVEQQAPRGYEKRTPVSYTHLTLPTKA